MTGVTRASHRTGLLPTAQGSVQDLIHLCVYMKCGGPLTWVPGIDLRIPVLGGKHLYPLRHPYAL